GSQESTDVPLATTGSTATVTEARGSTSIPPAPTTPPVPSAPPSGSPSSGSEFISSPGSFVKEQKPRPIGGFRGAIYRLTGGAWNLGPNARQREENELARRISRQLHGSYNTAVLSLKGGIG